GGWDKTIRLWRLPATGTATTRKGVDDAWIKSVQAMPPDKQMEAVAAKLKELNPGFDGKLPHKSIENGIVKELSLVPDALTDISPVGALRGLRELMCEASGPGKSKLTDLSSLMGLPLESFNCGNTAVSDLSPLKAARLRSLHIGGSRVSDLAPLRGMPLTV